MHTVKLSTVTAQCTLDLLPLSCSSLLHGAQDAKTAAHASRTAIFM